MDQDNANLQILLQAAEVATNHAGYSESTPNGTGTENLGDRVTNEGTSADAGRADATQVTMTTALERMSATIAAQFSALGTRMEALTYRVDSIDASHQDPSTPQASQSRAQVPNTPQDWADRDVNERRSYDPIVVWPDEDDPELLGDTEDDGSS